MRWILFAAVTAVVGHPDIGAATQKSPPRSLPITPYGKAVLARVTGEIERTGATVSKARTPNQVILFEVGFDLIERVRVKTSEITGRENATIVVERTGNGTTLTRHSGEEITQVLNIVEKPTDGPFIFGKDVSGYYAIPGLTLEISHGPFERLPQQLGDHWFGTTATGVSKFLDPDWKSAINARGIREFYGMPELLGDSYLVQLDEQGETSMLFSAENPRTFSIEFFGTPTAYGHFWRVKPVSWKQVFGTSNSEVLINKQRVAESVSFETMEDLGSAYILRNPLLPSYFLDKSGASSSKVVHMDDGKNLVLGWDTVQRPTYEKSRLVKRTNPSVRSLVYWRNVAHERDGAYLVEKMHNDKLLRHLVAVDDVSINSIGFMDRPWSDGDNWIVRLEERGRFYAIPKNDLRKHVALPLDYVPPTQGQESLSDDRGAD